MMERSNSYLLVYGSETGQAKSIAEQIEEKSSEFDLVARLHCLDETGKKFNIEKETCMVMVTSTTGDGDPPDNASKFFRKIKKKTLASDYLSHLHYTVLGLGDTNYNNFCKCPRDMDSRLEQLGAKRFYPTGLADDGVGLELVVDPWLEGLCPALKKHLDQVNAKDSPTDKDPLTRGINDLTLQDEKNSQLSGEDQSAVSNGISTPLRQTDSNGSGNEKDSNNDFGDSVDSGARTTNGSDLNKNGDVPSFKDISTNGQIVSNLNGKENVVSNMGDAGVCDNGSDSSGLGSSTKVCNGVAAKNSTKGVVSNVSIPTNGLSSNSVVPSTSGSDAASIGDGKSLCETNCSGIDAIGKPNEVALKDDSSVSGEIDRNIIRDSSSSIRGKDLTVPVLAPVFLQADYSTESFDTSQLPFQNGAKLPSSASDILMATVSGARVLTHPNALKKALWLKLNLKDQDVSYKPGDSISVICKNDAQEVQLLLERLEAVEVADQKMCLSLIPDTKKRRAAVPAHIPPTTTLRHALTTCVSIRDVPSKALLRALVEYTSDVKEKRRLQELCSKEGAGEYTTCLREKGVSLLDVLYTFPSCKPPVERVLEFLTRLLPRPYSICSCPEVNPNDLEIVFNIVEIPRDVSDAGHCYSRRGVCTGWLDDITSCLQQCENVDDEAPFVEIPMFFRGNQHFQPPSDLSKPLILIGPGTGVAPFLGFLQQRALLKSALGKEDKYGETWLFTGCRHKDKDYLFRDSLEEFEAAGTLQRLCVSFSRDAESSHRYVQDYMRSESHSLSHLLVEEEALVYVCGDAKHMAKDVSAAFQEILVSLKGMSQDEASAFVMKKRLHKTYLEDVWV